MANRQSGLLEFNEISSTATPASGLQSVYAKPDGFLYGKNSTGTEYLLSNPIKYLSILSVAFPAVAQANTTRVSVTGWSFPVVAGKSYKIEINANYSTAAATTGGSLGFTLTTAVGSIVGNIDATIVNTGSPTNLKQSIYAVNAINGSAGSFLTTTGMTLGGIGNFKSDCIFNCTTSGIFVVNWGTEVANSGAFIRPGSALIVTQLN
jgi:hypothetical protein